MSKKFKKYPWDYICHKQIYLRARGHSVDIHVYPVLQRLWDAGIQTFYSCQGGVKKYRSDTGQIKNGRAQVIVLKKNKKKVLKLLKDLNPKVAPWPNKRYLDRIAVYFDPSAEALAEDVWVTTK